MTQTERVLAALKNHPRGITQVDFLLPDVVDGGPPITRIGARILELRNQGHTIKHAGRRNKCVVYKLAASCGRDTTTVGDGAGHALRAAEAQDTADQSGDRLFDPVGLSKPAGAYGDVDEAA